MNEELITINFSKILSLFRVNIISFLIIPITSLLVLFLINNSKLDSFTCTSKILPEVSHKPNNGMSGLFLAAKSIANGKELYNLEVTSPSLYSDIVKSEDFYKYLKTHSPEIIRLIDNDKYKLYSLIEIITAKSGLTTIKSKSISSNLAINLNTEAISFLTNYLKNYRTQKAKADLKYLENTEIEDFETRKALIRKQQLIIQDQTPVFTILDQNSLIKNNKHFSSIYVIFFFISEILVLSFYLIKDKNYLHILEKTTEIKRL